VSGRLPYGSLAALLCPSKSESIELQEEMPFWSGRAVAAQQQSCVAVRVIAFSRRRDTFLERHGGMRQPCRMSERSRIDLTFCWPLVAMLRDENHVVRDLDGAAHIYALSLLHFDQCCEPKALRFGPAVPLTRRETPRG
jgi:hypothetical protein